MSWTRRSCNPPQRPDQPDVSDGVGELRAPRRLEVGQQVELAGVVGAVAGAATERHDTERVAAAAQRPRYEVRSINAVLGAAHDARPAGDGGALRLTRCHRVCSLQRRRAP
jgi:hypothetical protein